jgi:hypothetical protein
LLRLPCALVLHLDTDVRVTEVLCARNDDAALDKLRRCQDGIDTAIFIRPDEIRDAFDEAVTPIKASISGELRRMRSEGQSSGGEIVILVGKFAESPYLQERLGNSPDGGGTVLYVPPHPSTAVMAGAVHFAYPL